MKFLTRDEYHSLKAKKIYGKEDCPFCDKEAQRGHIAWEGKHWYILHNLAPYSGDENHLMAVPYSHKEYFLDLNEKEVLELRDIQKFVKSFYKDEHYFSCTRESMGHRSVEHFHMHFLPGKLQGKYLRKMLENQGFPIKEDLEC